MVKKVDHAEVDTRLASNNMNKNRSLQITLIITNNPSTGIKKAAPHESQFSSTSTQSIMRRTGRIGNEHPIRKLQKFGTLRSDKAKIERKIAK